MVGCHDDFGKAGFMFSFPVNQDNEIKVSFSKIET